MIWVGLKTVYTPQPFLKKIRNTGVPQTAGPTLWVHRSTLVSTQPVPTAQFQGFFKTELIGWDNTDEYGSKQY